MILASRLSLCLPCICELYWQSLNCKLGGHCTLPDKLSMHVLEACCAVDLQIETLSRAVRF